MDSDTAIHLTSQAMLLCLLISAPVVLLLGASWGGTLILRFAQSIMALISTPT
jgi:type III secretory pathway component EscS